jgi:hypothetical protein
MNISLQALIEAFETETADALALFLEHAELSHPFEWRERGLPRKGTLAGKPEIYYRFHGAGLYMKRGGKIIDFNLGFDGRTGGFSSWWLGQFAEQNPKRFSAFLDRNLLEEMLQEARDAGEIATIFAVQQDDLEYRVTRSSQTASGH